MRIAVIIGIMLMLVQSYAVNTEYPTDLRDHPWLRQTMHPIPADETVNIKVVPSINSFDAAALAPPSGFNYEGLDQETSPGPVPLFGNDVLVMAHGMPTNGKITTDQDVNNGDIYVSLLVPKSGVDDTVYTYRSTDGGNNWALFTRQFGNATVGGIKDHQVLIGTDATGTWFYSFVLYDGAGSMGGIWALRMRRDNTDLLWTQVVASGDTINRITVDRNIENPNVIFLGYHTAVSNIRICRSNDNTSSWTNFIYLSSVGRRPSVAAGGDGYGYIAYQYDDTTGIRVARFQNNLITPNWVFSSIDPDAEGDFTPSVAAARTSPGTSQVAWVLYRHHHSNGNADIRVSHTTNGGSSWSTGAAWPPIDNPHNTWDMKYPYVRVSYNSPLLRAVATVPEPPTDSIVYAFSRSTSPTTWEARGVHNDYRITGEYGARVDYSADCLGGYIVYRQFASANAWFDAYNFTGIEEQTGERSSNIVRLAPNPSSSAARLSFTLANAGSVHISIYDAAGKLVSTILDEHKPAGNYNLTLDNNKLAAGIYFVKLNLEADQITKTLTVVR